MSSLIKGLTLSVYLPQWWSGAKSTARTRKAAKQSATNEASTVAAVSAESRLRILLPRHHGSAVIAHVQVTGALDRHSYEALVYAASDLYTHGSNGLLLDLRKTNSIELSGLFALLSIARLFNGEPILDPQSGWAALRRAAEARTPALGKRVKLVASPELRQAIRKAAFCDFLEIFEDVEGAITSLTC
jgi:hypothetical protein